MINLSSSGILLLLTYAHKASEIVNTDRTIRIGNNRIPKHFLSKETFMTRGDTHEHENNNVFSYQRTRAKKETLFAKQKAFTEKCYRSSFGKCLDVFNFILNCIFQNIPYCILNPHKDIRKISLQELLRSICFYMERLNTSYTISFDK